MRQYRNEIEETKKIEKIICNKCGREIVKSKRYDNATSCSTENNIIVFEDCYDELVKSFQIKVGN